MARRSVTMACGLLLAAFPADAHHSIAGAYDTRKEVRIEGVVTQFEFINPHAFLTVDVRDTAGATQRWRVELDDRGELSEIGMTAKTLQPGHQVVVTGSPVRRGANQMYLVRLDRPADGYSFGRGARCAEDAAAARFSEGRVYSSGRLQPHGPR